MQDHQTGVNMVVQIDSVTSTHDLEQLICEPNQILSNSLSRIELIFTVLSLSVVLSYFTLIVTIKLFIVRLICKLNFHLLIIDMFGIMRKLTRVPYYLHCEMLIGIGC